MAEREFIMPVAETAAAERFYVEALRANTTVLEGVQRVLEGVQTEQKEQLKLIFEVKLGVSRIESNGLPAVVASQALRLTELETKMIGVEKREDVRDAQLTTAGIIWKNLPNTATIITGIVLIVFIVLRSLGRL